MGNRAVFLDRDGTIAKDVPYCRRPEDFEILPSVNEQILVQIHTKMEHELALNGAHVDGIYYCPHHPDENCACRKPNTALFRRAAEEFDIDLSRSLVIGDTQMDIDAGKALGCKTILVTTGPQGGNGIVGSPDYVAGTLLEAVQWQTGNEE